MSQSDRPIAIPWKVRLRYASTHWLQGVLFLVSLAGLVWLWSRRAPETVVVGQVNSVLVEVPAASDGRLLPLDHELTPFDRVEKDITLVAKFDVSEALIEMQRLTAERDRLQALIQSEAERLRLEQRQWDLESEKRSRDLERQSQTRDSYHASVRRQVDEVRREVGDLQQRRRSVEVLSRENEASRSTLAIEIENARSQRKAVVDLADRQMAPASRVTELDELIRLKQSQLADSDAMSGILKKQAAEIATEYEAAEARLTQAAARLSAQPGDPDPSIGDPASISATVQVDREVSLLPLRRALDVQEAEIRKIAQRIAANEIRAPVSGMVSEIHRPPGTFVRSGDPIVTIVGEKVGWIVAYVGQPYGQMLRKNDKVQIRVRGTRALIAEASIVQLGAQYEPVPVHLRANPNIAQWGLPVRISAPSELPLIPGELVDLVLAMPSSATPL